MLRLPQQHTGLGTDLTLEVPHWKVFPTEEDNSSTFQIFLNFLMTVLIVQLKFLISFLILFFFFLIKVGGDATTSVNVRAVEEAVVLCCV